MSPYFRSLTALSWTWSLRPRCWCCHLQCQEPPLCPALYSTGFLPKPALDEISRGPDFYVHSFKILPSCWLIFSGLSLFLSLFKSDFFPPMLTELKSLVVQWTRRSFTTINTPSLIPVSSGKGSPETPGAFKIFSPLYVTSFYRVKNNKREKEFCLYASPTSTITFTKFRSQEKLGNMNIESWGGHSWEE